jgi:hypothetical protein
VECGDATAYPLEVTQQQLEAIMYRVRDTKVTAGECSTEIPVGDILRFYMTTDAPAATLAEYDSGFYYTIRGYCTFFEGVSPDAPMPDFSNLFSATYYIPTFTVSGGSLLDLAVRDAIDEHSMWSYSDRYDTSFAGSYNFPPFTTPADQKPHGVFDIGIDYADPASFAYVLPYYNLIYAITSPDTRGGGAFRTGFSLTGESDNGITSGYAAAADYTPSGDAAYNVYAGINVAFNGKVAFIDTAENGNPFDPLNRMFVGVEFAVLAFDGTWPLAGSTLLPNPSGTTYQETTTLEFNFGGSGIPPASCPFHLHSDFAVTGITPFVITATKWWPYANSDGSSVWDSTTGQKL